MVDTDLLARRHPVAHSVGKELEILVVGDPDIDQPQVAIVAIEPQELGKAELVAIEVKARVDVLDPNGDMAELLEARYHECLLGCARPTLEPVAALGVEKTDVGGIESSLDRLA